MTVMLRFLRSFIDVERTVTRFDFWSLLGGEVVGWWINRGRRCRRRLCDREVWRR